jgi:F-type H+-transporting ATPase subunit epsilon
MSESRPAATFQLKVITPRALLVEADVDEAQIPTTEGLIGVLPGHRPLVVAIGEGTLGYRQGKYEEKFAIAGGTAEIGPERVLVLTETASDKGV